MPATVITCEADMFASLADRRRELGYTAEDVEHAVGLTGGHLGKIENGIKQWGKRPFLMKATIEWLLEHYGLTIVLMPSEEAREMLGPQQTQRLQTHLSKTTRQPQPNGATLMTRRRYRPAA